MIDRGKIVNLLLSTLYDHILIVKYSDYGDIITISTFCSCGHNDYHESKKAIIIDDNIDLLQKVHFNHVFNNISISNDDMELILMMNVVFPSIITSISDHFFIFEDSDNNMNNDILELGYNGSVHCSCGRYVNNEDENSYSIFSEDFYENTNYLENCFENQYEHLSSIIRTRVKELI